MFAGLLSGLVSTAWCTQGGGTRQFCQHLELVFQGAPCGSLSGSILQVSVQCVICCMYLSVICPSCASGQNDLLNESRIALLQVQSLPVGFEYLLGSMSEAFFTRAKNGFGLFVPQTITQPPNVAALGPELSTLLLFH